MQSSESDSGVLAIIMCDLCRRHNSILEMTLITYLFSEFYSDLFRPPRTRHTSTDNRSPRLSRYSPEESLGFSTHGSLQSRASVGGLHGEPTLRDLLTHSPVDGGNSHSSGMATMHRDAGTHSTSFSQEAGGGQQIIDELDDAIEPNEFGANQEVVVDGSDGSSARPSPNEELTLSLVLALPVKTKNQITLMSKYRLDLSMRGHHLKRY